MNKPKLSEKTIVKCKILQKFEKMGGDGV